METRLEQPLVARFRAICERFGEKKAIETDAVTLTYAQFQQRVEEWQNFLEQQHLRPGMRVMLCISHRSDFPALWLALWQCGAVPVPLEPTVAPGELARAMQEANVHWLLSENQEHRGALPDGAQVCSNPLQDDWLTACVSSRSDDLSETDIAFFIYTSGTVGTPKCVIYDHRTAAAIIDSLVLAYQLTAHDTILTPLTPALSATLITGILPGLVSGASLILPDEPVPGRVLKLLQATQTTIFFAVPYFYQLLIQAMEIRKQRSWESVRLCLSTSAFLPGETFDTFYALTGLPIRSIYCTSEANQCTFNTSSERQLLRNSVGQPQQGVRIEIVDDAGKVLAPGEEGQIVASGTHLSRGYYRRPELDAQVYRHGRVYTGDLGIQDADGNLYITGRLSQTINVSGHLVNPQEVEQTLNAHPAVESSLVLGEGDNQVGERVVGWVVIKAGSSLSSEELLRHCKQSLIHYKVPERIEFVSDLPRGRYGKIRRLVPLAER